MPKNDMAYLIKYFTNQLSLFWKFKSKINNLKWTMDTKIVTNELNKEKDPNRRLLQKFAFWIIVTLFGVVSYLQTQSYNQLKRENKYKDDLLAKKDQYCDTRIETLTSQMRDIERIDKQRQDSIVSHYVDLFIQLAGKMNSIQKTQTIMSSNPIELQKKIKQISTTVKKIN